MHFFIFRKKVLAIFFIICCSVALTSIWLITNFNSNSLTVMSQPQEEIRKIHLVTGEFESKTVDGQELESYRWDPGTIFVNAGEKIKLSILGINGREHPFMIEGTNVKGTVKQGEETIISLQFENEGIYRLICLTHPDKSHNGPMIAYIVVD